MTRRHPAYVYRAYGEVTLKIWNLSSYIDISRVRRPSARAAADHCDAAGVELVVRAKHSARTPRGRVASTTVRTSSEVRRTGSAARFHPAAVASVSAAPNYVRGSSAAVGANIRYEYAWAGGHVRSRYVFAQIDQPTSWWTAGQLHDAQSSPSSVWRAVAANGHYYGLGSPPTRTFNLRHYGTQGRRSRVIGGNYTVTDNGGADTLRIRIRHSASCRPQHAVLRWESAAEPVRLTSELVLTVVDATRPRGVRAELFAAARPSSTPAASQWSARRAWQNGRTHAAESMYELRFQKFLRVTSP